MKVKIEFTPIEVDVPSEICEDGEAVVIDYVNENWSELVDPSLPKIAAAFLVTT